METSVICKYMWICVHVTPLDSTVHSDLMYLFCLLWPALCTHRLLSVPAASALLSTSIHHCHTCPNAGPLLNHSLPYLDLQDRARQGSGKLYSSATLHLPVPRVWRLDAIWKCVSWNWSCYIIYTMLYKWHQALNPTLIGWIEVKWDTFGHWDDWEKIAQLCKLCCGINNSINYNGSRLVLTHRTAQSVKAGYLWLASNVSA